MYVNCLVKSYMNENHRSYILNFCSCEKKAWEKTNKIKNLACTGFEPLTIAIPVQCSTNYANKPTGSRSLNWFNEFNQFNDLLPVSFIILAFRNSVFFPSLTTQSLFPFTVARHQWQFIKWTQAQYRVSRIDFVQINILLDGSSDLRSVYSFCAVKTVNLCRQVRKK